MNLQAHSPHSYFERWGHLAVVSVLVLAFVTGGSASDQALGTVISQWLSLPLLVWALWSLLASSSNRWQHVSLLVAVLLALTVALQQLPLAQSLWAGVEARQLLADDLQVAGVTDPHFFWSLTPLASERGLWSLLPALAVFVGLLALPLSRHRLLLLWVVGLSAASLALGYLQLGAPQDSVLNPFPQWAPALNGFFANPNHQSTGLAIALVAITTLLFHDWGRDPPQLRRWVRYCLGVLAVLMLASLPLAGSRAAFLLAVLGLLAVPLMLHGPRRRTARATRQAWIARGLLGALAVAVCAAAIGWLRFDLAEEVRGSVAQATLSMGVDHAPWGAGLGSFVPWFDQAAPQALLQWEYFNHAHNEYAQWWLESGVLALLCVLSVSALLIACFPRRAFVLPDRPVAVAAWLGCVLLMLHSVVDYPLRTPALMAVAAVLLGISVAQRSHAGPKEKSQASRMNRMRIA